MPKFFVLRREHEDAFGRAGLARFAKKSVRMLMRDFGELTEGDEADLLQFVERSISFARQYGLRTERQMHALCEAAVLMKRHRYDLTADPTVIEILCLDQEADTRSHLIREHVAVLESERGAEA